MQFSRTRAQPWAGSIESDSPPFIRLEDPALDVGYGYGYRPALALPYLAGLFVIGWVVFGHAYPTALRPAKSGPG